MEESLVILRVMDTRSRAFLDIRFPSVFLSLFFYKQSIFPVIKIPRVAFRENITRRLRKRSLRSKCYQATVLIDRWRDAKRDYRDNTWNTTRRNALWKGIKLVERPINASSERDTPDEIQGFAQEKCCGLLSRTKEILLTDR